MKYYALIVDNEIKLIIPWKGKERPTPIDFFTRPSQRYGL